ncbi:hypothetical protein DPMN_030275 [Dreissena polymorpha]|uniref:Uncharacterized protein n=1 Tax=Dreissena polymorpha TaxID=45954 RepID=A0A9D4RI52_DREPO|nr:hypothetical protein DPMN_030275 [Dreissena polymorpha]
MPRRKRHERRSSSSAVVPWSQPRLDLGEIGRPSNPYHFLPPGGDAVFNPLIQRTPVEIYNFHRILKGGIIKRRPSFSVIVPLDVEWKNECGPGTFIALCILLFVGIVASVCKTAFGYKH